MNQRELISTWVAFPETLVRSSGKFTATKNSLYWGDTIVARRGRQPGTVNVITLHAETHSPRWSQADQKLRESLRIAGLTPISNPFKHLGEPPYIIYGPGK